jgi:hypothetical protein
VANKLPLLLLIAEPSNPNAAAPDSTSTPDCMDGTDAIS